MLVDSSSSKSESLSLLYLKYFLPLGAVTVVKSSSFRFLLKILVVISYSDCWAYLWLRVIGLLWTCRDFNLVFSSSFTSDYSEMGVNGWSGNWSSRNEGSANWFSITESSVIITSATGASMNGISAIWTTEESIIEKGS